MSKSSKSQSNSRLPINLVLGVKLINGAEEILKVATLESAAASSTLSLDRGLQNAAPRMNSCVGQVGDWPVKFSDGT